MAITNCLIPPLLHPSTDEAQAKRLLAFQSHNSNQFTTPKLTKKKRIVSG